MRSHWSAWNGAPRVLSSLPQNNSWPRIIWRHSGVRQEGWVACGGDGWPGDRTSANMQPSAHTSTAVV